MTSFQFPRPERVLEFAEQQARGELELAGLFDLALAYNDPSSAFELLLAMRIAERTVDRRSARRLLARLNDWQAFTLALLALGPDEAEPVVEALFDRHTVDPSREALALYLLRRVRGPALSAPFTKAASVMYRHAAAGVPRACLDLIANEDRPAPLSETALTIQAVVERTLALPMREWLSPRPVPHFSSIFVRRPRPP